LNSSAAVSERELAALYEAHPDAVIVAGATDVGLWVTKQHRALPTIIHIGRVEELRRIEVAEDRLVIGAGVTVSDAEAAIAARYPDFGELVRRFGSLQVRNAGTIGGNIANGSPVGDSPPALIALDATVTLAKGAGRRTVPLEDFFTGYGKQDRAPGEYVAAITVPSLDTADNLYCYKVSKRFDQDISAVCGCFKIRIEGGRVAAARIAFGGMAATPKRATAVEAALIGHSWSMATVEQALAAFDRDFVPISDLRASSAYRMLTAKNLLRKVFLESSADRPATRLAGRNRAFARA
jgi:xanthine dehydrogenase small subunit